MLGIASRFGGGGEDARGLGLSDNGASVCFDGFFYGEFFGSAIFHGLFGLKDCGGFFECEARFARVEFGWIAVAESTDKVNTE